MQSIKRSILDKPHTHAQTRIGEQHLCEHARKPLLGFWQPKILKISNDIKKLMMKL